MERRLQKSALRHLVALNLVKEVEASDGRSAVFNPNIWSGDQEVTNVALRVEDAQVRREVGALIEELIASPGLPEIQVTSTTQKWIDFAVAQGLVNRSVVQTTETMRSDSCSRPTSAAAPLADPVDVSGHVRQLVGPMVYATTFPRFKLRSPVQFVSAFFEMARPGMPRQSGRTIRC